MPGVHIQMFGFHWPYKSESLGISRIHSEDQGFQVGKSSRVDKVPTW
jgi:hypothetical protein